MDGMTTIGRSWLRDDGQPRPSWWTRRKLRRRERCAQVRLDALCDEVARLSLEVAVLRQRLDRGERS